MTVAMSNYDYAILVEAVAWIKAHAGNDAPPYPRLDRLVEVVDSIARRKQPDPESLNGDPPDEGDPGLHLVPPP
jgi:hypothetical protein